MGHARYPERPDCWHVYYGDVHVGTIAKRAGIPNHELGWGWACGSIRAAIRTNTATALPRPRFFSHGLVLH
jgi:hypothetical protein